MLATGRRHSDTTLQKMSASRTAYYDRVGRQTRDESLAKMRQINARRQVAWSDRTPEYRAWEILGKTLRKYNLTLDQYYAMGDSQDWQCAICGADEDGKPLCVDHSHTTGRVRKLLCSNCNTGLGMFADSHERLARATRYISQYVN